MWISGFATNPGGKFDDGPNRKFRKLNNNFTQNNFSYNLMYKTLIAAFLLIFYKCKKFSKRLVEDHAFWSNNNERNNSVLSQNVFVEFNQKSFINISGNI